MSAIYLLEVYAAVLGATLLGDATRGGRGATAIFFIDNNAALSSLLRGSTDGEQATNAILSFWSALTKARVAGWLERIRSERNRADDPSRGGDGALVPFPEVPRYI